MNRKKELRQKYPEGTRIRLIQMNDDPQPISPGSLGTVQGIDDIGNILMRWDSGRSLSLVPGTDEFEKEETDG